MLDRQYINTMSIRMFTVFFVILSCARVVAGDICGLDETFYCEYGCCYGECCSSDAWTSGQVIGLIIGLIFFFAICCPLTRCCYRRRYQPLVIENNASPSTVAVSQTVSSISSNITPMSNLPGPSNNGWSPGTNQHFPSGTSQFPPPPPPYYESSNTPDALNSYAYNQQHDYQYHHQHHQQQKHFPNQ